MLDRSLVLDPEAWSEWRDRGVAHMQLGDKQQALRDLQTYIRQLPDASDVRDIARLIDELHGADNAR